MDKEALTLSALVHRLGSKRDESLDFAAIDKPKSIATIPECIGFDDTRAIWSNGSENVRSWQPFKLAA